MTSGQSILWTTALQDSSSQKDNIMTTVKHVREKNRKYKEHLDRWLLSRRQTSSQEKTYSVQLEDRDHLVTSLQGVIEDQWTTIQHLEQCLGATAGSPPPVTTPVKEEGSTADTLPQVPSSSAGGEVSGRVSATARLIVDIKALHEDKAQLLSQLTQAQRQVEVCQSELTEKTAALGHFREDNKENNAQAVSAMSSGRSTDTEKQLETLQAENGRLAAEVSSLHRFYTRHPSLSFSPQAEQLRSAEEERGRLQQQLMVAGALQRQKDLAWKEQEAELQAQKDLLQVDKQRTQQRCTALQDQLWASQSEHRQTAQQLRDLQVKWTTLQARDPDVVFFNVPSAVFQVVFFNLRSAVFQVVFFNLRSAVFQVVTKVVQVEVESEQLKGQVTDLESQCWDWRRRHDDRDAMVIDLESQCRDWRQRHDDRDAMVTDLESQCRDWKRRHDDRDAMVTDLERQCRDWKRRHDDRDAMVTDLDRQLQKVTNKASKGEEENRLLKECLTEQVEKERQAQELAVSEARRQLETRVYDLRVTQQQMRLTAACLQSSAETLRQDHSVVTDHVQNFPLSVAALVKETQKKVVQAIERVSGENKNLVQKYHKEMRLRKKYHNELVELKGNIRVLCRVRPPIKEDGTGMPAEVVVTYDPDDDGLLYVANKGRGQSFEFDRVFSPASCQTEVFEEVKALVTSCIDGFNVCIFAYGQTGSGKTFTMEGPESDPGINQRALLQLFSETTEKGQDWQFTIEVSVLEIYNETIRDLLNSDSGNKLEVKMKGEGGGYHVPGLVTTQVSSLQQVNQVFAEGRRNRATATTNMNEHSSRSHCLLRVTVSGVNPTTSSRSFGRLNLVDLAGSERVSKSGTDGTRLKEAQSINKSLAALGDVIHALRAKQSHVPFRNSKLTYLLQDSLEGDSKTLMIVQVAPVEKNVSETTYTLGFGQRVRTVELGQAKRAFDTLDSEQWADNRQSNYPTSVKQQWADNRQSNYPTSVKQQWAGNRQSNYPTSVKQQWAANRQSNYPTSVKQQWADNRQSNYPTSVKQQWADNRQSNYPTSVKQQWADNRQSNYPTSVKQQWAANRQSNYPTSVKQQWADEDCDRQSDYPTICDTAVG
ncbi:hypothetical protein ACOMHN_064076 [Nucella lapillus]